MTPFSPKFFLVPGERELGGFSFYMAAFRFNKYSNVFSLLKERLLIGSTVLSSRDSCLTTPIVMSVTAIVTY